MEKIGNNFKIWTSNNVQILQKNVPIGLEGFLYWSRRTASPFSYIRLAIEICESGCSDGTSFGVRIIVAPRAFITFAFSADILSGIVIMHSQPWTVEAKVRPIPVFPDVASTIFDPGLRSPLFSASRTILLPMRSLIDPPMFIN